MADRITTNDDPRRWRTEIPNFVDDLGLDVYERAVYWHYRRRGVACTESLETTARILGISTSTVSAARRGLVARGLMSVTTIARPGGIGYEFCVKDLWGINMRIFMGDETIAAARAKLALDGSAEVKKMFRRQPSPHEAQPSPHEAQPSPHEAQPSPHEAQPSVGEGKKEPIKNKPIKKRPVVVVKGVKGTKRPPAPPAKPTTTTAPAMPPSVAIHRKITQTEIDPALWGEVESIAGGDLQFWEQVVVAWKMRGWKLTNIGGMLDYVRRHEVPSTSRAKRQPQTAQQPVVIDQAPATDLGKIFGI